MEKLCVSVNVRIREKNIGENHQVFVIAEIASAHQGDVDLCKKLIEKASEAKADGVKFQKFICDELIVRSDPKYKVFKEIEFSNDQWREIISYAKRFDIAILADVFDEKSADLMDELGVSAFKIHPSDINNPYLLSYVAKKGKPLLLGVGGATIEEIREAINTLKSKGNEQIILVHGFQAYPTRIEDVNLRFIPTLKKKFGLEVGYHDHTDAESPLAFILPLAAVALGASLIEKHLTLDRQARGYDYHSALHYDEFSKMVKLIREIEKSLGTGEEIFSKAEREYGESVKRKIVARKDILPNTVITLDMLAFKRSKNGLPLIDAAKLVGKKAKTCIKKDESITWDKVI